MNRHQAIFFLLLLFLSSACRLYKQDVMFKVDENYSSLKINTDDAERNYKLQPNDLLELEVFTNKGEAAIDPNYEFRKGQGQGGASQSQENIQYLVQGDGTVKFPIIGSKKVTDLTVDEVESMLEQVYNEYYKESFVKLKVINRRVIVLGDTGGKVIPLTNENTNLIEVLALYGGLELGAKAHNIRLIRGDLTKPQVFLVDLSTIEGMKGSVIPIQSGDIVYIEPGRRPWLSSARDVFPLFSIVTSLTTLILLFGRIF